MIRGSDGTDTVAARDKRLTVLFDGECPLCSREVAWCRGLDTTQAIRWVDAARCPPELLPPGVDRTQALARFHAMLPDGRTVSGSRAFIAVWRDLPSLRWLARVATTPPIPAMLELGYRCFLQFRPRLQRLAQRG